MENGKWKENGTPGISFVVFVFNSSFIVIFLNRISFSVCFFFDFFSIRMIFFVLILFLFAIRVRFVRVLLFFFGLVFVRSLFISKN